MADIDSRAGEVRREEVGGDEDEGQGVPRELEVLAGDGGKVGRFGLGRLGSGLALRALRALLAVLAVLAVLRLAVLALLGCFLALLLGNDTFSLVGVGQSLVGCLLCRLGGLDLLPRAEAVVNERNDCRVDREDISGVEERVRVAALERQLLLCTND